MRICWRFSKGLRLPWHPDRPIHAGGYFTLFCPQCEGSKGEAALTARPVAGELLFAHDSLEFPERICGHGISGNLSLAN